MGILTPNIAKLKHEKRVNKLVKTLRNNHVRHLAIEALVELNDRRAVEPLKYLLKNKNRHVRLAVVSVLGKMPYRSAIKSLCEALQDDDYEIRERAILALGMNNKGLH